MVRRDPRACLVWCKQACLVFSSLSYNVLSEIVTYLQLLPYPFWVTSDSLTYLSPATKQVSPSISLETTIDVNANSRWAAANSESVVVCGGGNGILLYRQRDLDECIPYPSFRLSSAPSKPAIRQKRNGRYRVALYCVCIRV